MVRFCLLLEALWDCCWKASDDASLECEMAALKALGSGGQRPHSQLMPFSRLCKDSRSFLFFAGQNDSSELQTVVGLLLEGFRRQFGVSLGCLASLSEATFIVCMAS